MNKLSLILVGLIFTLLVTGCSSPAQVADAVSYPSWVSELPTRAGWIYGVGSAEISEDPAVTAKLARQRARLDLARSLKTDIQGTFVMQTTDDNGEVSKSATESIKSAVEGMELYTLEFVETETIDGRIFVLAGLSRQKEAAFIRSQMAQMTSQGKAWQPDFSVSIAQLQRLVFWQQQISLWQEKQQQLDLITGRPEQQQKPDFFVKYNQFVDYLVDRVEIEVLGDLESGAEPGIQSLELARSSGWPIVSIGGNLKLKMNLKAESVFENDTHYHFINGHILISDLYLKGSFQREINIRAVSSLASSAKQKAEASLENQIRLTLQEILPDPLFK